MTMKVKIESRDFFSFFFFVEKKNGENALFNRNDEQKFF